MLALEFNDSFDLTAIGTLALAVATFASLIFARRALNQTQREIELSRREIEEAHRPVLVPLADSRRMNDVVTTYGHLTAEPAVRRRDNLTVPIENIGTGPALRVEASVQMLNPDGGPTGVGTGGMEPAVVAGIKASGSVAPTIKIRGLAEVPGFWLTLTYEDVAGKGWITKTRYIASEARYTDLTIETREEGAYGLQGDRELRKSVSPSVARSFLA